VERRDPRTGARLRTGRYGAERVRLPVVTLDEELAFVRALNASTGREAGIYTEVKEPAFHRRHGLDASRAVLETLARHGYTRRADKAFVQCFDAAELKRLRTELGADLKLIQLIGENAWGESATDYAAIRTPAGLDEVARVADGIGPWLPQVLAWSAPGEPPQATGLVAAAHARGLAVHAYTLRLDQLPPNAPNAAAVHAALLTAGIDGLFSDFPDATLRAFGR
jgi:glycerophosphoryl diester phosphodiesterase